MSSRATSDRRALGRYVLGPAIGRGATAVVHRAHDIVTGEDVAVKVVPVELDLAPRVRAEVRAAGRLDHPRIVALRDWGEDSECLLPGVGPGRGPVAGRVAARGPSAPATAPWCASARTCSPRSPTPTRGASSTATSSRANILIDHDGRAQLSRLRRRAPVGRERPHDDRRRRRHRRLHVARAGARRTGGPRERRVFREPRASTRASPGSNPVNAASPAETARRAAAGGIPTLGPLRPELPRELCRAIDAGLAPRSRCAPDADELADVLSGARGGVRAARRRGSPRAAGDRLCRHRRGAGGGRDRDGPRADRRRDRPRLSLGSRRGRRHGDRRARLRLAPARRGPLRRDRRCGARGPQRARRRRRARRRSP